MSLKHSVEHEWRVELPEIEWADLLKQAGQAAGAETRSGRVVDLVMGRHGFESVGVDGYIVRLRGPAPYRLEIKERMSESAWKETFSMIESPDAIRYILTKAGLYAHLVIDRERHTIETPNYTLCFDDVLGLGKFVEIETSPAATGDDPLCSIVDLLETREKLPPYGDIVKHRLLTPEFAAEFRRVLEAFEFETAS